MAEAEELGRQALACLRAGDPAAATRLLRRAASLDPDSAVFAATLGDLLQQEGDFSGAEACFRQALRRRPGDPALRRALHLLASRALLVRRLLEEGVALAGQERPAEAESRFIKVLRYAPRAVVAQGNLGALQLRQGEVARAIETFETAVRQADESEDSDRVRCYAATARLLRGDFAGGWPAFEARWRLPGYRDDIAGIAAPRWTGAEEIAGKRLLLLAEQGFGDTLQFVRYARLVAARGGKPVLVVPPALCRLLAPLGEVHAIGAPLPPADFFCPMMSLPLAFGTTLDDVPADAPYLSADPARWRGRLAALPGRRVGVAWAGGAHAEEPGMAAMDRRRSLPSGALAPLGAVAGVSLVSLQVGPAPDPGVRLHDWTAELADFAETAGLVAGLDLVIAVDTAVAHLAGALGRPVWLLNRFDTCWRWLQDREDSPWYPSLRQFRQESAGDWQGVVERVAAALDGGLTCSAPPARRSAPASPPPTARARNTPPDYG